jgi:nucleoid-associated protein YgaU
MGNRHYFDCLAAAFLFLSVQGCAFFSGKADPPPFPPDLAASTQPVPLPVEVAKDISVIAKGGTVEPVNPPLPAARVPDAQPPAEEDPSCACEAPAAKGRSRAVTSLAKAKPYKPSSRRKGKAGADEDYTVKRDDTLMKISFEKFGNVYRWREIYNENKDRIPDYNQLVEGTVLKIKGVEYVVIERNGLPYLIRRNDTLVKISRGIYGTPKRWKHLWDNNRQLIHDPNKIYAGFTLYYQPDGVVKPTAAKLNLKGPLRSRLPAAKK